MSASIVLQVSTTRQVPDAVVCIDVEQIQQIGRSTNDLLIGGTDDV